MRVGLLAGLWNASRQVLETALAVSNLTDGASPTSRPAAVQGPTLSLAAHGYTLSSLCISGSLDLPEIHVTRPGANRQIGI